MPHLHVHLQNSFCPSQVTPYKLQYSFDRFENFLNPVLVHKRFHISNNIRFLNLDWRPYPKDGKVMFSHFQEKSTLDNQIQKVAYSGQIICEFVFFPRLIRHIQKTDSFRKNNPCVCFTHSNGLRQNLLQRKSFSPATSQTLTDLEFQQYKPSTSIFSN